ncbi:MAG: penicillin acylase family protein [Promethearchaeota archaeon]
MNKKLKTSLLLALISLNTFLSLGTNTNFANGSDNVITIVRDNYGVPHIFAETKEGLAFGAGYALAQDRLWQADLFRRMAFGSLAEFGLASIASDYYTRSLGYSKGELLEIFENWEPTQPEARLKEMMLAYVDGLNLYIYEALTALAGGDPSLMPIEYLPNPSNPFGLPLEPFTIEDCTAIVVMMAWRFGGTGGNELSYAARLQALQIMHGDDTGWEIFNDLYPQVDPGAPVTIPSKGYSYPKNLGRGKKPSYFPENIGEAYNEYQEASESQTQLFESLGLPTKFGSNAWIVGTRRSKSRNALQVGGPQMGHSIPQIVSEIGLHGAGIDAVGMMMPHAPTILIGVSQYGAWTSTTGASDVMDTYIEVLNPENPYQYWYNGEWVDMEKRTERIYGFRKWTHQDKDVYRTIHGPIIAWDLANNLCYTMKTPYYKNELAAEEGWSLFQQSRNIKDMEEACKVVQPNHNFFWIDRGGNIGYWHSGVFPIKPTHGKYGREIDDRFPLWGTGEEEWIGVTGFDEVPKCINPPHGYLANWNNKPQANWPYTEADWGETHRVKIIQDLLKADVRITFEDMENINRDAGYNHEAGMYFLDYLIEAAKTDPNVSTDVIEALEAWNHHYNDISEPRYPHPDATYDDPGLTIFNRWFSKIDNAIFDDDLPSFMDAGSSTLLHVFDGEESKLPLNYDYLNGEDRDQVIVQVLKEAITDLAIIYGSTDISTWLTPVMTVTFSQQGAYPAPTMHAMNRGTYNHIAEMPRWKGWHRFGKPSPIAVNVIPPGQSGFMNLMNGIPNMSPHAYDQLELYETWTYKPVLFSYQEIWIVAESVKTLYLP